ncbi:MAG TPA: hypothetical protein VM124_02275 [Candidatus Limnocylindrales bacterium]|nr:hypothetical protein [Candidatus Limnocylindrales bacterium]
MKLLKSEGKFSQKDQKPSKKIMIYILLASLFIASIPLIIADITCGESGWSCFNAPVVVMFYFPIISFLSVSMMTSYVNKLMPVSTINRPYLIASLGTLTFVIGQIVFAGIIDELLGPLYNLAQVNGKDFSSIIFIVFNVLFFISSFWIYFWFLNRRVRLDSLRTTKRH